MVNLPLSEMSVNEKLRVIEEIWNDVASTPEAVTSPQWHRDVIEARESRIAAGKAEFTPWNEAKDRIRDKTSR